MSTEKSSKANGDPETPSSAQAATPTERTILTDNVKLKPTGNKLRDNCSKMLYAALASGSEAESGYVSSLVNAIESRVFQDTESQVDQYKARIRSLTSNLKDKSNPGLRESILDGSIGPDRFARMTPEEMMSEDRKAETEKAMKEVMNEVISAQDNAAETDMFKCGKCRKRKTKYYQMQTRSADEPMTTFVTCVNCGHKWKFC